MSITINCDERDIEDFLCSEDYLKVYLNLKYIDHQVKIDKFFIDILAYNKIEKCFYIIELKKDELNARAFIQALKYLKLMDIRYNHKHKFKMLLIGRNLNEELYYNVQTYNMFDDNNYPFLYTLYDYNFEEGISFNYINIEQKKIQDELNRRDKC